jgi:DNA-binding transcriptional regulator YhcF (GntR family)
VNLAVDTASSVPPYEQLRAQLAAMVASGSLAAGTRLATVRQMAADLGLAPNTVARAYRELEADGLIDTHGRRGTFVRSTRKQSPDLRALVADYVSSARALGLTCPEALALVQDEWSR